VTGVQTCALPIYGIRIDATVSMADDVTIDQNEGVTEGRPHSSKDP
jgi:hypothetical protein